MCTIAIAKVQRYYNCYNVYFNECLRLEGEDCSHPAASKAILLELRTNLYDYLVFVEVHGIGLFVARLG